jgi:hypothetical protein
MIIGIIVSSKWNKCRIYVGDQLDRCRWMERTQGSAWLLLISKPSMLPSFLNRLSYFMNLWWCLVSKQCACSRRVRIEGHMNRFEYCHPDNNSDNDSFGSFSYLLQHNSVLIFISIFQMEQMQDICRGSVGPLPLDGANSRKCLIIVDR